MLTTPEIRKIYDKIQRQLFIMIPEKWDTVYLYASVLDHYNNLQTGEMFFYYYPKGVLKKNPVNVYEVPSKFNIEEKQYLKLAEELYNDIKQLRKILINLGEKAWTNITIYIKDFKFNVEYNYEDLTNSDLTSYDRHLIWKYKYLDTSLSSFSRKDRKMIEKYLSQEQYSNKNINTYNEGIYNKPKTNIIEYNNQNEYIKKDDEKLDIEEEKNKENSNEKETEIKSQILKF